MKAFDISEHEVRAEMHRNGIFCQISLKQDGVLRRFANEKPKNLSAWYVWHPRRFSYGDYMGHRKFVIDIFSFKKNNGNNDMITEIFKSYNKHGTTEYIKNKHITAYRSRFKHRLLCVPMNDFDSNKIISIQYICDKGKKNFRKGIKVQNLCLKLNKNAEFTVLCEGYATGCTLFEYGDINVIICFSAVNLSYIAKKSSLKNDKHFLCFDNDPPGNNYEKMVRRRTYPFFSFMPDFSGDWNDIFSSDDPIVQGLDLDERKIMVKNLIAKKLNDCCEIIGKKNGR